jgi:hypothetical protein
MLQKKKELQSNSKFIPMPECWPGKISADELFEELAKKVRFECQSKNESQLVTLRIQQLGVNNLHDFTITLPKKSTIYRVQSEIAKIQHQHSVFPKDVIIFRKKELIGPAERLLYQRNINSVDDLPHSVDKLSIGIHNDLVCDDESKTLIDYFPDIITFKTMPGTEANTIPCFLHDSKRVLESLNQRMRLYSLENTEYNYPNTKEETPKGYSYPSFTIFYDILPYATIATYRNDFDKFNKNDKTWMLKPIITTDIEHLVTPIDRNTVMDVHSYILQYSIGKALSEIPIEKTVVKSKPKISRWANSIRKINTMQNAVQFPKSS